MSLSAQFTRIAEDTERSAHDRLVEAVQVYKIEHPETCERMHNFLKRQMSNSTQLSTAGERDRSLFFNKMHEKVDLVKDYLNLDSKMAIL